MQRRVLLVVAMLVAAAGLCRGAAADEPVLVRIQMKWKHDFQFAGYYAALAKGYFQDAGLRVDLIEGGPALDPTDVVLSGRAEFGIGTSGLLVNRSRGLPVVAVASVFQHSPYLLIARKDPAIRSVRDLVGRRIMVEPHAEELLAYLHREDVDISELRLVEHSGNPLDLATGRADAMTAYTTTEPFVLNRAGIAYTLFDPKIAGIDFYGDTLFTSEAFAAGNEAVVIALRDAVVAGWLYALAHPDEIIDLILRDYDPALDRERLRFNAYETRRLLIPDLIEIGYMNTARWARIADAFRDAGLMAHEVALDDFLFAPRTTVDWTWVYLVLLGGGLVTAGISAVLWKVHALNRHLQAEIRARRLLEQDLQALAVTDPGTGLLNRRGFLEAVRQAIARGDRRPSALTLLALDLDHFKAVNDGYGHAAGDLALACFAAACRRIVREVDVAGRIGGEEFMIALTDCGEAQARVVAERLRAAVAAARVRPPGGDQVFGVTVSIGLAERGAGESLEALMSRADTALYRAKAEGRDRVVVAAPVAPAPHASSRRDAEAGAEPA